MATQKTALRQLIEMIETRIKSIPATECGTYEHGQYEASSSIIDWVKSELLPVEREHLIEARKSGLKMPEMWQMSKDQNAEKWFNETYGTNENKEQKSETKLFFIETVSGNTWICNSDDVTSRSNHVSIGSGCYYEDNVLCNKNQVKLIRQANKEEVELYNLKSKSHEQH